MPLFNSNSDVIDITELQKRGILKKLEEKNKSNMQQNTNEYINLKTLQQNTSTIQPQSTITQQDSSPLSFLDSLASSNFQTTRQQEKTQLSAEQDTELKNLQVKIENIEYKLDRFMDKLAAIEAKISAL